MTIYISERRLTGPAVFVSRLSLPNLVATDATKGFFPLSSPNRYLLRLTRLAMLAFYRVPYKRS